MNNLLYIIIIIIIILIYNYNCKLQGISHTNNIYRNILSNDTLELVKFNNFYNDFKDIKFELEIYNKTYTGYPIKKNSITLKHFFDKELITEDNYYKQIILYLDNYNIHNYSTNIINLYYNIKKDFSKLFDIDKSFKMKFRISKTPWMARTHFDALNGYLLQLINTRNVYTLTYPLSKFSEINQLSCKDLIKKYTNVNKTILNKGDITIIPMGLIHCISSNSDNISVAVSIYPKIQNHNDTNTQKYISYFKKYYQERYYNI
tara:strand:+ start:71 stop:853 length:783 start_codon:yes stop_codon:yes gene_type:complete